MKKLLALAIAAAISAPASAQQIPLFSPNGQAPTDGEIAVWYADTVSWCSNVSQNYDEYWTCLGQQVVGARFYAVEVGNYWKQIVEACDSTWIGFLIPECYIADDMVHAWGDAASYIKFELNSEQWCDWSCDPN